MDNKANILINLEKKGNGADQAVKDLKKVEDAANKTGKKVKDVSNNSDFNKTVNVSGIATALSKVSQKLIESVKKSADYIETLNLLDVAYDGNTEKVKEWTKQYSEILNLDDSTLISSAAHFKVLSQSMGLATETGEKFAKLLTQMTLDVSSLYNMDFSKAQTALQYAVEGRGTSLKQRTGVSVLETSVQTTLDTLGIEAYVENMNDAEKAIARLISMEYQLQASQGDLARTIEMPANQFRVLKEQAVLAARGIGNIFLGAVANLLPYINGLLIAINAVIAAIASLFGFGDFISKAFGGTDKTVSKLSDSFKNMGSSVGGVGKAADSTKKKLLGLRGFDKLNVIKTPTDSGGAGGSAGGGAGVNPKLLEAFDEMADLYDSKLEGVRTKATEISEQILKWLGFSKDVNGEWEHTEWTYGDILLISGGIGIAVLKVYNLLKKLGKLGLFKGIQDIFSVITTFINSTLISKLPQAFSSIMVAIKGIFDGSFTISEAWALIAADIGAVAAVAGGIVSIIAGMVRTFQGIKDLLNGDTFNGVLEIIEGIALAVAGVALLIGAWPVAIGAAIAAIVALVIQYWNEICAFFAGVGEWFSINVIQPIMDKISPIVNFVKTRIIEPIISFFKPIVEAISTIISTIIKNIKEIVSGVYEAITSIVEKIIEIGAKIVGIFVALGKAAFTYIIKPIAETIAKAATLVYQQFIKPVLDFFGAVASYIFNHVINPIWSKIIWVKDQIFGIFKVVGSAIADFVGGTIKSVVNGVLSRVEKTINSFIRMLNSAISIINKIPGVSISRVSLLSIPRLAQGGLPDQGQMFIANERGPELVGQIGGQSFVANQNQMMDIIDKKLSNAGGLQNATFVIQVGSEEVARTVLKDLNSMAKSNGKPITIGG